MNAAVGLRGWVKGRNSPLARLAYETARQIAGARLPTIRPLHRALYGLYVGTRGALARQ